MAPLRPSTVPPVTAVAIVVLGVVGLGIASTAAAAALPTDATGTTDLATGTENATDGTTSTVDATSAEVSDSEVATDTVDETTTSVTEPGGSAAETVESDASGAVTGTVDTVEGTAASTAEILGTTVEGTAGLTAGDELVTLGRSLDTAPIELSAGSQADEATDTGRAASTARAPPTTEPATPARSDAGAAGPGGSESGPGLPHSPVTLGGLLIGGLAVQRALALSTSTYESGTGLSRAATRAVTSGTGPEWRDRLWRIAGLLRYGRYDDSDPLEHDTRAAIQEVIEERGGAYLSEISRATAVPLSTVRYHLGILEHEDLVAPAKMRGKRLYFPVGSEPSALRAALTDDGAAAVLAALASHGPDSVSGLADRLGRDVSTVSHHLQRLADGGLVRRERDGQAVENRLTPAVRDAITGDGDGTGPSIVPGIGGRQPSD